MKERAASGQGAWNFSLQSDYSKGTFKYDVRAERGRGLSKMRLIGCVNETVTRWKGFKEVKKWCDIIYGGLEGGFICAPT